MLYKKLLAWLPYISVAWKLANKKQVGWQNNLSCFFLALTILGAAGYYYYQHDQVHLLEVKLSELRSQKSELVYTNNRRAEDIKRLTQRLNKQENVISKLTETRYKLDTSLAKKELERSNTETLFLRTSEKLVASQKENAKLRQQLIEAATVCDTSASNDLKKRLKALNH
jgi:chromosome segregation ATPase